MKHLTHMLHALVRLVRPSQGVHVSPFGYVRELAGELRRPWGGEHRRNRARRVRRYAERIPSVALEPGDEPGAEEHVPAMGDSGTVRIAERPVPPRVPAPRRPSTIPGSIGSSAYERPVRAEANINVSVPAAIVRGRCFVSGRATGARPVESRKLALAVLCALADQAPGEQAKAEPVLSAHALPPKARTERTPSGRALAGRVHGNQVPGRDMLVVGEAA